MNKAEYSAVIGSVAWRRLIRNRNVGECLLVLTVPALSRPAGATSYSVANKKLPLVLQQQLCCHNHQARFEAKQPKCHSKFVKHAKIHWYSRWRVSLQNATHRLCKQAGSSRQLIKKDCAESLKDNESQIDVIIWEKKGWSSWADLASLSIRSRGPTTCFTISLDPCVFTVCSSYVIHCCCC